MTDLPLLASGRDADVFELDEHRVLRRYREGGDVGEEAVVMRYLSAAGYPVPQVHDANGRDLVMERLNGPTLLARISEDGDIRAAARILSGLHSRLHEVPPRLGASFSDRILHLDLHPDNVMLTDRGPVLIDWRNSREGPPDLDVAMTALIMADVAVDTAGPLAAAAMAGLGAFLQEAPGEPLVVLDAAVALRRVDPNLTEAEVGRLHEAAALVRRLTLPTSDKD